MTTNTTISPSGAAVALAGAQPALFPMEPVIEVSADQRVWLFTWAALINGAAGVPIGANGPIPYRSAFFEATGVFGNGGSVQIEGSNDGASWYALSPAALTERRRVHLAGGARVHCLSEATCYGWRLRHGDHGNRVRADMIPTPTTNRSNWS
jgi:hypothetical protein